MALASLLLAVIAAVAPLPGLGASAADEPAHGATAYLAVPAGPGGAAFLASDGGAITGLEDATAARRPPRQATARAIHVRGNTGGVRRVVTRPIRADGAAGLLARAALRRGGFLAAPSTAPPTSGSI